MHNRLDAVLRPQIPFLIGGHMASTAAMMAQPTKQSPEWTGDKDHLCAWDVASCHLQSKYILNASNHRGILPGALDTASGRMGGGGGVYQGLTVKGSKQTARGQASCDRVAEILLGTRYPGEPLHAVVDCRQAAEPETTPAA